LNGKHTALLTLLLISVVLTGWLVQRQTSLEEQRDLSRSGPDLFVEGMDLKLISETGTLRYRVQARRLDHFPYDDHSELAEPVLEVFREDQALWYIQSERGRVSSDNERVWLLGEVEIRRLAGADTTPFDIHTRDLLVKPAEETAETQQASVIQSDRYRVEAVGVHADLREDRVELKSRVRGRINVAG
jgi:lipopolysaccharide export system protein LptC